MKVAAIVVAPSMEAYAADEDGWRRKAALQLVDDLLARGFIEFDTSEEVSLGGNLRSTNIGVRATIMIADDGR